MAHHRSDAVKAAIKAANEAGSSEGLTDIDLQAHVFLAAFDAAIAATDVAPDEPPAAEVDTTKTGGPS